MLLPLSSLSASIALYATHTYTRALSLSLSRNAQNLVRLHGGVWNEGADKLCIVLELCVNGSLDAFLNLRPATSWEELGYGLALGAAKGLRFLHHELKQPLIHRDIKASHHFSSIFPLYF